MPRFRRRRQPRIPEPDRQGLALGRFARGDQGFDHRRPHRRDAAVRPEQGSKDVAHYVLSLSGSANDSIRTARGEPLFKSTCAACHGADGKGNAAMGAPNLSDGVWLHGSGEQAILETINKARQNQMPAHKEILSPAKIHLLTAYVYSLSMGGPPASK